jgi:hypothetical protein
MPFKNSQKTAQNSPTPATRESIPAVAQTVDLRWLIFAGISFGDGLEVIDNQK